MTRNHPHVTKTPEQCQHLIRRSQQWIQSQLNKSPSLTHVLQSLSQFLEAALSHDVSKRPSLCTLRRLCKTISDYILDTQEANWAASRRFIAINRLGTQSFFLELLIKSDEDLSRLQRDKDALMDENAKLRQKLERRERERNVLHGLQTNEQQMNRRWFKRFDTTSN